MKKQASISSFEQGLNIITAPPVVEPITIYPGPSAKHANMPKADLELMNRLKQLKSEGDLPSEAEVEQRLAKLKGLPADYYKKPGVAFISSPAKTEHQQTEDLLAQMMDENKLQMHSDSMSQAADDELFKRLARIRGSEVVGPAIGAEAPSLLDSPGMPPDVTDVEALLQQAQKEMKKEKEMKRGAKQRPTHQLGKHGGASGSCSSSEKERMSDSSDFDSTRRKVMTKRSMDRGDHDKMITTEEEDVSRIVSMYMQKAQDRKQKKKKKMLKKKTNSESDPKPADAAKLAQIKCSEAKATDTDSSSELSEDEYTSSSHDDKMSACSS